MPRDASPLDDSQPIRRGVRRLFRIAIDPRKLVLAAAALAILWCGNWGIARLPFASQDVSAPPAPWSALGPLPTADAFLAGPQSWETVVETTVRAIGRILQPIGPLWEIARLPWTAERSWSELAVLWTQLLWALAVWSLFGGAIARLAALEFARGDRASLRSGFTFASRRFFSCYLAPLLPIAAVGALWGLCALGGLLGRIGYVGPMLVALLWGLGLALGLLIVLIALAACAGWPLMIAGVATEASDGFDGFSRSFTYIYSRLWLFVRAVVAVLIVGGLLLLAMEGLAVLVATTTTRVVATGRGADVSALNNAAAMSGSASLPVSSQAPTAAEPAIQSWHLLEPERLAEGVTACWFGLLVLVAEGFAISLFWSGGVIVYFLLRQADDGTALDEVWLPEELDEEDHQTMPLPGIAATSQPVTERSHEPTIREPAAD